MKVYGVITLILGLFAVASSAFAESEALTATDYGSLYMIEERQTTTKPWQLGIDYGRQLDNPYLDVQTATVTAIRNFGQYFGAGLQASRFFATESTVTSLVQQNLATQQITQSVQKPLSSYYAVATATPLSGRLNLFSYASLPFDLVLGAGAGGMQHTDGTFNPAAEWFVSPQLMVSSRIGVHVSAGQQLDGPFASSMITNFEGRIGTFVRF